MSVGNDLFSIEAALDVVECAIKEVAETALDLECEAILRVKTDVSPNLMGAYIPLLCGAWGIDLGIASDKEGCAALASALMMLEADDDPLPEEDVADAIGEVANLLAGGVKTRLHDEFADLRLGTPLILHGYIEAAERQRLAVSEFKIGSAKVEIVILLTH